MEIAFAQETDAERWDAYVSRHAHASPYHFFAWRQSIETAYHQQDYYLMALNDQSQIIGVLPCILIKLPFGPATLCSLPYCDRGEALADSPAVVERLVSEANILRKRLKARRYEYRSTQLTPCNHIDQDANPTPQKVRMILDLPQTSEALFAGFKSKLRSQIRRAEKNGLRFDIGSNASLINDFYDVFTINMRDLGSPTHSKRWFESVRRFYAENCIISIVYKETTPIGAGLVLINGTTATVPWASTLRSHNKLAPNMLLYWSLLKYATDNGCQHFDFGRSTVGEGTYKFKEQWGARAVALDWNTYPDADATAPTANTPSGNSWLRQTAEYVWRKVPLALTVRVGSRVRRYISL